MLYLLLVAVVCFALADGVYNISATTRYSPVLVDAAILRASEVDWLVKDCSEWHSYDYRTANVREVSPTHRGGRNISGSKRLARERIKVSNVIGIRAMFDAREQRDREKLAEAWTTPVDQVSPVVPPNTEKCVLWLRLSLMEDRQRRYRSLLLMKELVKKVAL